MEAKTLFALLVIYAQFYHNVGHYWTVNIFLTLAGLWPRGLNIKVQFKTFPLQIYVTFKATFGRKTPRMNLFVFSPHSPLNLILLLLFWNRDRLTAASPGVSKRRSFPLCLTLCGFLLKLLLSRVSFFPTVFWAGPPPVQWVLVRFPLPLLCLDWLTLPTRLWAVEWGNAGKWFKHQTPERFIRATDIMWPFDYSNAWTSCHTEQVPVRPRVEQQIRPV